MKSTLENLDTEHEYFVSNVGWGEKRSGINMKLRRKLDDNSSIGSNGDGKTNRPSDEEMSNLGKQAIISMPSAKPASLDSFRNDPKSKYFIVFSRLFNFLLPVFHFSIKLFCLCSWVTRHA
mgnify:CR=1 FL=1